MKKIILLLGSSGSGKTTLGDYLKKEKGIPELISHTTRKPREGEVNGVTYHFITKEEFDKIDRLEETCYSGNYYALSREEVERHKEKLVYAIVDAEGVKQIRQKYGWENVIVVYVKITYLRMIFRMLKRGDKIKDIGKRVKNCIITKEMKNYKIANIVIENKDFQQAKFDMVSKLHEELYCKGDEQHT